MTIKLAVFDVDGTLAKTEESIAPHIARKLREYENQGIRIVLISGRTASYLAGLARGMGIKKPLVAGENGGVIFDPTDLLEIVLEMIEPELLKQMKESLLREFGKLWFQPNQTMLTAAPLDLARIDELYQAVLNLKPVQEYNFTLNKYYDSVEVMHQENSKGRALAVIKEHFQIAKNEVIVFGNTEVDLPMSSETDQFNLIGNYFRIEGVENYPTIEDAFRDYDDQNN